MSDSGALLDAALANLATAITESGAEVRRSGMPSVCVDPAQFIRLLQNLIGNSIKFRKPGEPPVIEVGARKAVGGWVFSIKDNGVGIAPENMGKVFVVFQRFHGNEYPGTGLGLAICKKIVERHGGRIWVESEPGKGCAFSFTLPEKTTKPTV
jgi:signal transduction histidine kinase